MIEVVNQLLEHRSLSDQFNELVEILEQDFDVTVTRKTGGARTKVILSKQNYDPLIFLISDDLEFIVKDHKTKGIKYSCSDISGAQRYLENYFI